MKPSSNTRLLRKLLVVAVLMFGFGFALVPFYRKICEVTGVNALLQPDALENTQVDLSRSVAVTFDANVRDGLPVTLRPKQVHLDVHPGQLTHIEYVITNKSEQPLLVQAIPSYAPAVASRHFTKLECFCFRQQRLKPGETRSMPVVFVVDTSLPAGVGDITLSYSLFRVAGMN